MQFRGFSPPNSPPFKKKKKKELLKTTPEDHQDRDALEKSISQIENIVTIVNERKREKDNQLKLKELAETLDCSGQDLKIEDPNRRILLQGHMKHVIKSKEKREHAFLFNDMLLLASTKKSSVIGKKSPNKTLKLQLAVPLSQLHVQSIQHPRNETERNPFSLLSFYSHSTNRVRKCHRAGSQRGTEAPHLFCGK
jgi:hypothetical protein